MTFATKAQPPGGGGCALELPRFDGLDNSKLKPPYQNNQINCATRRADELRLCLSRAITRTISIGTLAQAALYDGDDDIALACLRLHWRALRVDIAPLAAELGALQRAREAR